MSDNGVELFDRANVIDIKKINSNKHEIVYKKSKVENTILSKKVIVAPGRTGAKWVQELADKYDILYYSRSIEIGVRVEVRKEIMEDITGVIYDPTIFIKTKTYGD